MSAHDVAQLDYAVAARGLEDRVSGDLFVTKPNARGGLDLATPLQQIADRILAQHGKGADDELVLVGRWGAAHAARPRP
jgi:hypothetical protein